VRSVELRCSDAVDGDRRQAEHVSEEGAHRRMRRCVTADEADPANLHVFSLGCFGHLDRRTYVRVELQVQ
jgi:hypothetical protein